ncbi:hypothetical protein K450DRAFT_117555 [Umbelopsis ramanniana AG]|uniref:ATP-dependent DNA helicase n=1 Tax=Umbelopsis ramanniana AG TaxID=1314678 RepID=A0AAD5EFX7_UMBRA|nr:uncharacterized protein K450DRAFT_117555 [Umbelopsis ramanniana AG]KAI8583153.1 hypothetical protein K450DRAFT_117555 [Umbelopsis ramanniana AG]
MTGSTSDDEFDSTIDEAALLAAAAEAEDAMFADFDESLLLKAVELTETMPPQQHFSNQPSPRSTSGSQRQHQSRMDNFFSQSGSSSGSVAVARPNPPSNSPVNRQSGSGFSFNTVTNAPAPQAPPAPPPEDAQCAHFFDAEACTTWVYPINYPIRNYQFNIVQRALFNNTLVAMPTGLGKTFIAAVVMYNYFRWFPTAKIVFMAPTKPLVNQQIEACFKICGVPQDQTAELTGAMPAAKRKTLWNSKRLFFITPQILQNDLNENIFPVEKLACLVVDEAHKATGGYAYAVAVRKIKNRHKDFRVLALTATPGTSLQAVQKIVDNLLISNIQIRTEDSLDIQEFSHGKSIQTVVVSLSYMQGGFGMLPKAVATFREAVFLPVLKSLHQFKAIHDIDPDRNTPYMLMQARGIWQTNSKNFNKAIQNIVFSSFLAADVLSRAHDLLCQHGTGPFVRSMKSTITDIQTDLDSGKHVAKSKISIARNPELKKLLRDLERMHEQPDYIGHPKMDKLLAAVLQHLTQSDQNRPNEDVNDQVEDTRIMIFSSLRESVNEIVTFLSKHEPIVRCTNFVGQAESKGSKGLNQKEQQEVISKFKRGLFNVLVSTSIGEEGLDIGEVDLIICYDSQSSPIRMIQRLGRTGRKRKGRCVLLLTELEERKYKQAKDNYKRVQDMIARRDAINYYPFNPVILPNGIKPVPAKTVLSIGEYKKPEIGKRKRNQTVDEFRSDGTLGDSQEDEFRRRYLQPLKNNNQTDTSILAEWMHPRKRLTENKYTPLQTILSNTKISHSFRTVQFVSLVSKMERRILNGLRGHSQDKNDDDDFDMTSSLATTSKLLIPKRRKNVKSLDDSSAEIIPTPAAQETEPDPSFMNDSPRREEINEDEMELADDILQDVIMATELSPDRNLQRPLLIGDKPNADVAEGSQDGAHDKPSFVFISSDDTGIFGKNLMESPIKQVIKSHTESATRASSYRHEKASTEASSHMKFTFNDRIVPVYPFEAEANLNSVRNVASSRITSLSRPTPYSSKGHSVLLNRWSILSKQNGKSLRAIEEALQEYLSKEYKATGKTFEVQKDEMRNIVEEYDDDMDFDDNLQYQTDEGALLLPNDPRRYNQLDDTKSKQVDFKSFANGDDFGDDLFDLSSEEGNTGLAISHENQPNSIEQPTPMSKNDDAASYFKNNGHSKPPRDNFSDSDEDCLEFDFAELDLTILENKLDLEGGYTLAERSPPFRSVKNYSEVIALSSDSDTPVLDDTPRRSDNRVSDEDEVVGYGEDDAMNDMHSSSLPAEQSRKVNGFEELLASPEEKPEDSSLLAESFEHGHSSSNVSNVGTMSQKTSPLKHRHTHAQRRQRILYSSQTDDAFSSPLRPSHTNTLAPSGSNSSPSGRRIAPKVQLPKSAHFRQRNPFLDLEASESGEGASSDVEDDQRSSFIDSFIDDNTIGSSSMTNSPNTNRPASTNMYAIYRQSLISPEQKGSTGSNNIFNHTNRPRYLQRVLENLDNAEEAEEEDSLDLTEPSERLLTTDQPTSQNSHASDSAHLTNSYDSDFM